MNKNVTVTVVNDNTTPLPPNMAALRDEIKRRIGGIAAFRDAAKPLAPYVFLNKEAMLAIQATAQRTAEAIDRMAVSFVSAKLQMSEFAKLIPLQEAAPRRRHTHRKNQSLRYHLRIQKKWRKRFGIYYCGGTVGKTAAFIIEESTVLKTLAQKE